jgi:acetolactate synthase-1/2/3 large subunit
LPVDIMFSSFDEDAGREERPYVRTATTAPRAWPDPAALEPVLALIAAAKRPIIIGGHGVWWSGNEGKLEATAKALNIPVFNIPYHQKLLGEDNAAYMGLADIHQYQPSRQALEACDVVVIVGGRLDNQMNFGNAPLFPDTLQLVCVNGSFEELEMNRSADHVLLSDPGAFFDALLAMQARGAWSLDRNWFDTNRSWRGEWVTKTLADLAPDTAEAAKSGGKMHPLQLSLDVQAAMGEKDWLVFDGGNTHFWAEIAVNLAGWGGQKLAGILHPGTFSMLGVGVSMAVAAKNTHPDATVVLISGDGAFLSGGLSIEAAFQENLPIVVVIDNNGGLDCISQQQERLFANGKHFATDFRDIPFHTMFEGMGGHGELVERREQLGPAIRRAIASGKTACVNVKAKGVISPIVLATTSKRDKASIE